VSESPFAEVRAAERRRKWRIRLAALAGLAIIVVAIAWGAASVDLPPQLVVTAEPQHTVSDEVDESSPGNSDSTPRQAQELSTVQPISSSDDTVPALSIQPQPPTAPLESTQPVSPSSQLCGPGAIGCGSGNVTRIEGFAVSNAEGQIVDYGPGDCVASATGSNSPTSYSLVDCFSPGAEFISGVVPVTGDVLADQLGSTAFVFEHCFAERASGWLQTDSGTLVWNLTAASINSSIGPEWNREWNMETPEGISSARLAGDRIVCLIVL